LIILLQAIDILDGRHWQHPGAAFEATRCHNVSAGTIHLKAILENNKSLLNLSVKQGQMGDGSSPCSLSLTGIGRTLSGLPVSRRHSPRQAEFSAS
jgi:hypothetical protein